MTAAAASYNYIQRKIAHLKRVGLVSGQKTGFGKHGGACPDWLVSEQKEAEEKRDRNLARSTSPAA